MTTVVAHHKHARISAQKARLVIDLVRGKSAGSAVQILKHSQKKAADLTLKVLQSAIANAEHNNGLDIDELVVASAYVNEGPSLKRIKPRAKGRADRIIKRSCHITVCVKEQTGA